MKDSEFIYSLYVQANPVPDPDLLPLTRDEAVLLLPERSPDMITQEETQSVQPTPPKRSRIVAALAAAAIVVVAVVAVALAVGRGTQLVAAADAKPIMTFDGSACGYEGPALIEEGMVEFTLTNSADVSVSFVNIRSGESERAEALEAFPVGSENVNPGSAGGPGTLKFTKVPAGESLATDWPMPAGFYVLDCATGDPAEHVWRAAQVEVVAP